MTGPDARAIVAMEVLVEGDVVAEVGIAVQPRVASEDRPPPIAAAQEEAGESLREVAGHLGQCRLPAGAGGVLHGELVAQEVVELLERLDEQVVDRKPDRAAPVAVPSEQTGAALPGLVAKR